MPRGPGTFPAELARNAVTYAPGLFVIDGLEGPYEGFTDGSLWNGWACPVFERDVANRIADDMRAISEQHGIPGIAATEYNADADAFVVVEDGNDPVMFGPEMIEVNGRTVRAYALGTRYWTWEAAQEAGSGGT